ncbi:MAG: UDP-glucose 6-dehydrogenase [Ignavibacteriales bacterium CG07_land_8_20_14_0_80_59_12]|nr:MAG: UDP-glucose 6-dehydrogenase [Ignavibacteriales bacterium CG07_land_8_20_14_0_80_59_12]
MRLAVIGTGYVGLVAGACFAENGNDVICVDVDEKKIKKLKKGIVPIYEPGLEDLVNRNLKDKRLSFTTRLRDAVDNASVIFLVLPTPPSEDGSADLSHVLEVAGKIAGLMKEPKIIVNKSTVPVGTADRVREVMRSKTDIPFDVVSNPEFLKQGAAVEDFMYPDRVIVGTRNPETSRVMQELYDTFLRTSGRFMVMDERSAEVSKYAANALLATKISFINEIANICELAGADVDQVRRGLGADPRIGPQFLFPGLGYGGSCFPKDTKALIKTSNELGYDFKILKAVEAVNGKQKLRLVDKAEKHFGSLKKKKMTVWGLSFKPRTDDLREAPSLVIIRALLEHGATVRAHDPVAIERSRLLLGDSVTFFENNYDALRGADALFLVTEWNDFRHPDFGRMKTLMKTPVIFDGRNIYDPRLLAKQGFTYYGIGR